jgi:tetratricopeptide (TPR) repeat protein
MEFKAVRATFGERHEAEQIQVTMDYRTVVDRVGRRVTLLVSLFLIAGCDQRVPDPASTPSASDTGVLTTLVGTPLRTPNWSPATRASLEKDLEIAEAVMAVAPEREDSYIWLGRRLGYLTRWSEAIEVFTQGLERFPDSYKLLRFRGRHHARARQFGKAIEDYRRAAELVEDAQDSYEPDGIINARHQFLGSYRSNIHYYLGQTSWAVGDYESTVAGMERAAREPMVQHDDRRVATSYWRYLALRKLGRDDEARAVVQEIPEGLTLVENFTYYQSVLFFNGSRTGEEILPGADAVIKLAVAMEHSFRGETDTAKRILKKIVDENAQGFWPAESELVAMGG